jgi:hypothetical protein
MVDEINNTREALEKALDDHDVEWTDKGIVPVNEQEDEQVELETTEKTEPNTDIKDQNEGSEEVNTPEMEPIETPNSWSGESKQAFAKLPKDLQQEVIRREKETQSILTRTTQEKAGLENTFKKLDEKLTPYAQDIKDSGLSPEEYLAEVCAGQRILSSNPRAGILQLMQNEGITVQDLLNGNQGQQSINPDLQRLQREIAETRNAFEADKKAQAQAIHEEQTQNLLIEAQNFIDTKDSLGNPKYPFIEREEVIEEVSLLAKTYRESPSFKHLSNTQIWEKAYNKAISDNGSVQADLEKMNAKAQQAAKLKKVQDAKRAGSSITGSSEVSDDVPRMKSTRDAAIQAMRDQGLM